MPYRDDDNEERSSGTGGRYRPQRSGGTSWITDAGAINTFLQQNQQNPELQQAIRRGPDSIDAWLHDMGYGVVPNTHKIEVGRDGRPQVSEKSWWDKHQSWVLPAATVGGAIAAGPILGALGGGGGAAGTVPTTTGLSGSGFGAGGGLGYTAIGGGAGAAGSVAGVGGSVGASAGAPRFGQVLGTLGRTLAGGAESARAGRYQDQRQQEQFTDQGRTRAGNAVRGDILAGAQPTSFGAYVPGQGRARTGGLSPALLSDPTRQLGRELRRSALEEQLRGPSQPSRGERLAGGVGTAAALGEAAAPWLRRIPSIGRFF